MQDSLLTSYFQTTFGSHQVARPYFVGAKRYTVSTYFIDNLADMVAKKRDNFWSVAQSEAARKLRNLVLPKENLKDKRPVHWKMLWTLSHKSKIPGF